MSLEAEIRQRWDRLFAANHALDGGTDDAFGMGANAETIARAERRLGFALPAEIKASSRIHDGVSDAWEDCDFYTLEDIPEQLIWCRNEAAECPPFRCDAGVLPPQFGAQLIPFARGADDTAYCLDYNPGEGGVPGQVSAVCLADASIKIAAGSYVEFLERGARRREGRLKRARARGEKDANEAGGLGGCLFGAVALVLAGVLGLLLHVVGPLKRLLFSARLRRAQAVAAEDEAEPPRVPHPPKVRQAAAPGSIAALWYEIEDLNRALGYNVDEQFFGGASEDELDTLERALGRPVPADLRELFAVCAACDEPWTDDTRGYDGFIMQDIPGAIADMCEILTYRRKLRLFPGTRMPEPGPWLIPIETGDGWLCYDLKPGEGGRVGQIVDIDLGAGACRVVAPSLRAWLETGVAKLKAAQAAGLRAGSL